MGTEERDEDSRPREGDVKPDVKKKRGRKRRKETKNLMEILNFVSNSPTWPLRQYPLMLEQRQLPSLS